MKKLTVLILTLLFFNNLSIAQITLTHNVGTTPIKTDWVSCEYEENWARVFKLSDFGISTTEQFIIRSGQVAISNSYEGARIIFNVYSIDEDFPNSTLKKISSGNLTLAPLIGDTPQVVQIDFFRPIVVPSGVERILIEVVQADDIYNPDYKKVLIAGTEQDNDTSWFKGCRELYTYTPTENLTTPIPDANFYINVTGEKLSIINTTSNAALSHNVADDVIRTQMFSCTSSYQYWGRKFVLEDFNIGENEELIINKGEVGLSEAGYSSSIQFNIYKIDENFPSSFSESDLIGSSQVQSVPYFSYGGNGFNAKISLVDFDTPIVIPSDVKMILVEVHKGIVYGDGVAFVAGTEESNDDSWYRGCNGDSSGEYRTTQQLWPNPNSDINFYVTVYGKAQTILPFSITNTNKCINFSNELSLTNQSEIDTVVWNFDDPTTGANNTSTLVNTNHQFSSSGTYNVTANVLHIDGTNYTINKEVKILETPIINENVSLKQCDDNTDGFSAFNLNEVANEIITNPTNYTITYHETLAEANADTGSITNTTGYINEVASNDRVWARVENSNGCYRVSEVNLVVSTTQIPNTVSLSYYECDNGADTTDGIATFDFSAAESTIRSIFPANQQLLISFYQSETNALAETNAITDISNYQNTASPNRQTIYVRVDSAIDNDCLGLGGHITLNVDTIPVANPVTIAPQCDNDRDGVYSFDTSTIQNTIIGNQTNVTVSYVDENGMTLPSPLPNPFVIASQTVTARITNSNSQDPNGQCYDETPIVFIVNNVPIANPIPIQEACDDDFDGVVGFNTANIESTLLGGQTGMVVRYFDANGVELPSPLPNPFNMQTQDITVRIENPVYAVCYEETLVSFVVREKPDFNLIQEEIICMTSTPNQTITIQNPSGNYTYTWMDENNNVISNNEGVTVISGGIYSVFATSAYGCTSEVKQVRVAESSIAEITRDDIEVIDDSNNNSIRVTGTDLGLGDYEFQLLDEHNNIVIDYQSNPSFNNLEGGIYRLNIRDRNGCGEQTFEISLLSFPPFFTPNNDGINDTWQIKGVTSTFYSEGIVTIFNRYGKPVGTFTINDVGWNGVYGGRQLPPNDYWFSVRLIGTNGTIRTRKGNFSLLRK